MAHIRKPPRRLSYWQKKKQALVARMRYYAAQRQHRTFRPTRGPRKIGGQPLPKQWLLLKDVVLFLKQNWWLMLKLGLVYMVVSYVVVGGLSQVDFVNLKQTSEALLGGSVSALANAGSLFVAAISGSLNSTATELQQFLGGMCTFVFWLAMVWAVRMRLADRPVKVRDALYNCCSPLVPAAIALAIVIVQLLPAGLGIFIFSVAQNGGQLQNGVEFMLFAFAAALLCVLSLYWLSTTLLSLVIITLPGTYPWKALSGASRLVYGQRFKLLLRVVVLGILLVLMWAIVLIPTLLLDAWININWLPLVPIVVQALSAASLVFISVYVYKMYRSLL